MGRLPGHGKLIANLLHPIYKHRSHVPLDSPSLNGDKVVWIHQVKGLMPLDLAIDNLRFQNFSKCQCFILSISLIVVIEVYYLLLR